MNSFNELGLLGSLLKSLKDKNLSKPSEIQARAIPLLMNGSSVVGVSETGSGKTLAYALPMLHLIKTLEINKDPVEMDYHPRGVVVVPTSELGDQVSKVFKTLTHDTRVRVRPALGAMTKEQARRNSGGTFEILIATPGRLVQLIEDEAINLTDVRMLVFDEADQMMDQGFLPDSNIVVGACPTETQLALFSATVSPAVQTFLNERFGDAEVIRTKGSGKTVSTLITKNLKVQDGKRWPLLEKLLKENVQGGTILFSNTREQCDKLAEELQAKGYEVAIYRGEMDKIERRQNLKKFKDGKVDLLVATDLAGRGLDLEAVGRVINYHLPKQMENYLHRAGRTARAGRSGLVINLVTERDERLIAELENRKANTDEKKFKAPEGKVRQPPPPRDSRLMKQAASKAAKGEGGASVKMGKPLNHRSTESKSFGGKTQGGKSAPGKMSGSKTQGAKPAQGKSPAGKSLGGKSQGAKPADKSFPRGGSKQGSSKGSFSKGRR